MLGERGTEKYMQLLVINGIYKNLHKKTVIEYIRYEYCALENRRLDSGILFDSPLKSKVKTSNIIQNDSIDGLLSF